MSNTDPVHRLHSLPETDTFTTLGIPVSGQTTEKLVMEWLDAQTAMPRISYVLCSGGTNANQCIGFILNDD